MKGVLTAEPAILLEFKTIRIILLILCRVVISLFAFAANECYFHSHSVHLPVNLSVLPPSTWKIFARLIRKNTHNKKTPPTEVNRLYHFYSALSSIFIVFTINFSTIFIKKQPLKLSLGYMLLNLTLCSVFTPHARKFIYLQLLNGIIIIRRYFKVCRRICAIQVFHYGIRYSAVKINLNRSGIRNNDNLE